MIIITILINSKLAEIVVKNNTMILFEEDGIKFQSRNSSLLKVEFDKINSIQEK